MVDRGPDGQMWLTVDDLETGRKNFSKATKMEFRVKTQGKKLPEFSLNTSDVNHIQSKIFENSRFCVKDRRPQRQIYFVVLVKMSKNEIFKNFRSSTSVGSCRF